MKTDAFGAAAALSGAGGVTIYRLRALLEQVGAKLLRCRQSVVVTD